MKSAPQHWQSGMSLLEVLIAALVLSIGMLGLAGLQVSSLRTTYNASMKQEATFLLYELLERMRSNRASALAGHYSHSLNCTGSAPKSCMNASCSEAEMAMDDLYQVFCKRGTHPLPDGELVVSCPTDNDCKQGLKFKLTWVERIEQAGIQGEATESNSTALEQEPISLEMDAII